MVSGDSPFPLVVTPFPFFNRSTYSVVTGYSLALFVPFPEQLAPRTASSSPSACSPMSSLRSLSLSCSSFNCESGDRVAAGGVVEATNRSTDLGCRHPMSTSNARFLSKSFSFYCLFGWDGDDTMGYLGANLSFFSVIFVYMAVVETESSSSESNSCLSANLRK